MLRKRPKVAAAAAGTTTTIVIARWWQRRRRRRENSNDFIGKIGTKRYGTERMGGIGKHKPSHIK